LTSPPSTSSSASPSTRRPSSTSSTPRGSSTARRRRGRPTERTSRRRAPDEEVRLEAGTADHAHGDIWPGTYTFTIRASTEGTTRPPSSSTRRSSNEALPHRAGRYTMIWVKGADAAAARDLIRASTRSSRTPRGRSRRDGEEFQNNYLALLGNVKLFFGASPPSSRPVILLIAATRRRWPPGSA